MTDNEIIKALECCEANEGESPNCKECPYPRLQEYDDRCYIEVRKQAIGLINRQKAEIERFEGRVDTLNKQAEEMKEGNAQLYLRFNTAKNKGIKEFAERFLKKVHDNHYVLEDRVNSKDYGMFTIGIEQAVNETKEEMTGRSEDNAG